MSDEKNRLIAECLEPDKRYRGMGALWVDHYPAPTPTPDDRRENLE